jgi:hypothetical protein
MAHLVCTPLTIKVSNRALSILAIVAVRTTPSAVRNLPPGVARPSILALAMESANGIFRVRDVDDADISVFASSQQGEVQWGVVEDGVDLFLPWALFCFGIMKSSVVMKMGESSTKRGDCW